MVDREVVLRRLRQIDQRVAAIRSVVNRSREDFESRPDLQAQCERHLQVALQAAIDIALHLLSEDTAETPDTYGAAFTELAAANIISPPLADKLRTAAGLRNILVHAYLDVDPGQFFDALADLGDLADFAEAVLRHIG